MGSNGYGGIAPGSGPASCQYLSGGMMHHQNPTAGTQAANLAMGQHPQNSVGPPPTIHNYCAVPPTYSSPTSPVPPPPPQQQAQQNQAGDAFDMLLMGPMH